MMRYIPIKVICLLWISLQLKAYYWALILLLGLLLYGSIKKISAEANSARSVYLASLLFVFSSSLLLSAWTVGGAMGLIQEIPIAAPVVPLFFCALISAKQPVRRFFSFSGIPIYLTVMGLSTTLNAIFRGLVMSSLPASTLRPLEVQSASGVFLTLSVIVLFAQRIGPCRKGILTILPLSTCSLLLSSSAFLTFRGLTSGISLVASIVVSYLLLCTPLGHLVGRRIPFVFAAILILSLFLDLRFILLKYLLAPWISSDASNGRFQLLLQLLSNSSSTPRYVGPLPGISPDFFAHNLIIDSAIKDGLLAASSLSLFLLAASFFIFKDLAVVHHRYNALKAVILLCMALPAMLQPVQFANSFSFLLSISTVGLLASPLIRAEHRWKNV